MEGGKRQAGRQAENFAGCTHQLMVAMVSKESA